MHDDFEAAAETLAAVLGPARTKTLAGLLRQGRGKEHALYVLESPASAGAIDALYETADAAALAYPEVAAYLQGYVAATRHARAEVEVRTVWSGPSTPSVPVRATAHILAEVVRAAETELLAMTYAARPYADLTETLNSAVARGVRVDVVVETLEGAGGLLAGPEPAAAFRGIPGVRLWHWTPGQRTDERARLHAKLAVADRRLLLLGSANLTEAGAHRNIEAGVLVRGGHAPERVAEHIAALQRTGVLEPLSAVDT